MVPCLRGSVITVTLFFAPPTYLSRLADRAGGPAPTYLSAGGRAPTDLDAAAAHAERPMSLWCCCGGVRDGRHYYCDSCNLYFHECWQKNQSKGRQAPLCPPCHERALAGAGGRARRRV